MYKKIIGGTLLSVLLLVAVLLITGLFLPRNFMFHRSIVVNAPVDSVWKYTGSLAGMDKWSPWNDYDSKIQKKMSAVDGVVGASSSWKSEVVGEGKQTIYRLKAPSLIVLKLDFTQPYESHASSYVELHQLVGGTRVEWGMTGEMPYPFNTLSLFMDMEKMVARDFETGLAKLKVLVEK